MRPPLLDPTAGERARAIRARPGVPQPIFDPTDPRCPEVSFANEDPAADARAIFDPTDPECGQRNA
jgi:hypothetical protein